MGEHDRDDLADDPLEPHLDARDAARDGRWDPHGLEPDRAQPPWRARRGLDPDLRRMGKVAGAFALAVLAVGGGWSMLSRRGPRVVPVIEAPSGPLRVRPDNPGGMQLAGGVDTTPDGTGTLAPPPEVPQPGALRAQIQAGQKPQAPAADAPPAQTSPAQAPPAQAPLAQVPLAQRSPAQAPAARGRDGRGTAPPPADEEEDAVAPPAARPAAPSPPAHLAAREPPHPPATLAPATLAPATPAPVPARPDAAPTPDPHGAAVQLAAMASEQGAAAEWQRLSRRMPELLSGRRPDVQRAEHDGHPIWRLRTAGFASPAQASEFCAQVRAKGVACSVAAF